MQCSIYYEDIKDIPDDVLVHFYLGKEVQSIQEDSPEYLEDQWLGYETVNTPDGETLLLKRFWKFMGLGGNSRPVYEYQKKIVGSLRMDAPAPQEGT